MSLHYHLLVEMDLVDQVSDEEWATLRWLIGRGQAPQPRPEDLTPLISSEDLPETDHITRLSLPGGPTSALRRRRPPASLERATACWSLAMRTVILDDTMYETGFAFHSWLGQRSRQDVFIGLAREESTVARAGSSPLTASGPT